MRGNASHSLALAHPESLENDLTIVYNNYQQTHNLHFKRDRMLSFIKTQF
jgi:hypothetical protein